MLGFGYSGMMSGFGVLGFITWLVVVVDLVLLGVWLAKNIK